VRSTACCCQSDVDDLCREAIFDLAAGEREQPPASNRFSTLTSKLRYDGSGNVLRKWYDKTKYLWIAVVIISVGLQGSKNPSRSAEYFRFLGTYCIIFVAIQLMECFSSVTAELIITFIFDFEILWRFFATLPDWRRFWQKRTNSLDLFLAVTCTVIQIPPIRESNVYPWLTIFQLLRFYRVIMVFPRMKPLLVSIASLPLESAFYAIL
jgi:voltage-dependent calcium channel